MMPRDYQQRAIDDAFAAFDGGSRSALALMATGTGKTVLFAHIARHYAQKGRCLIVAHRDELIRQAAEKIHRVTGIKAEIEKAEEWANDGTSLGWHSPYVIASIQSLSSGTDEKRRMHRFDPNDFALLVIDECHHSRAATYEAAYRWFSRNPDLHVLGVTATGDRGDGKGLGPIFEKIIARYELPDAIRDGWLVPVRQRSVIIEGLDFSKVRTTAGDLNAADLEAEMLYEKPLHGVAHATIEAACGLEIGFLRGLTDDPERKAALSAAIADRRVRKTLVFAAGVKHAERLAEIINRWIDGAACMVCGATAEERRKQIMGDYHDGRFPFLVNVGVCTEGFDEPGIELISQGRKTKSRALAVQMIGRGTRPLDKIAGSLGELPDSLARRGAIGASAKPYCEVLDFCGNAGRHKLVSAVDILAGEDADPAVVARANELTQGSALAVDEAIEQAEMDIAEDRAVRRLVAEAEAEHLEEAERNRLIAYRGHLVGTAAYQIHDVDESHSSAPERREISSGGSTDRQIEFLVKLGVQRATAIGYTKRQAGAVIESLKQKRCTGPQGNLLRRHGYTDADVAGMNFEDARHALDAIFAGREAVA